MRDGSIIHSGFSAKKLQVITIYEERINYLENKGYEELANLFKSKLFSNLYLLWSEAYSSKDKNSLDIIESQMKKWSSTSNIKVDELETKIVAHSIFFQHAVCKTFFYTRKQLRPVKRKIQNARCKIVESYKKYTRRKKLRNTDFSIISNNCWGGLVYQYFGLQYTSPTVGLFFMDEDYIKFIENLDYYLSLSLKFISINDSRYKEQLQLESTAKDGYPIALLDDIEVHFLHYHSIQEAEQKWNKRLKRLNRNKLLIKMSQRTSNGSEILERFERLPFKNKICFTEYERCNPIFVTIPELHLLNIQGGDETPFVLDKVDILTLINGMQ